MGRNAVWERVSPIEDVSSDGGREAIQLYVVFHQRQHGLLVRNEDRCIDRTTASDRKPNEATARTKLNSVQESVQRVLGDR